MHHFKAWIRAFFGFSRRETNAFIILLPLTVVILFSEPVYRYLTTGRTSTSSENNHSLDSLVASLVFKTYDSINVKKKGDFPSRSRKINFHSFDPNIISANDFIDLGLSKFIASRIIRYREKGGKFKKKEDLQRIYGIDSVWYAQAKEWISLPAETKPEIRREKSEKRQAVLVPVNLNDADTTELMKVFGIGPGLSKRICSFREKLGGFISMNQIKEVYGLDSSVVKALEKKFYIDSDFIPRKININKMQIGEINHPYLKRREMQAIIAYRTQHGNFVSIEQLKEVKILSEEWLLKIMPYLEI